MMDSWCLRSLLDKTPHHGKLGTDTDTIAKAASFHSDEKEEDESKGGDPIVLEMQVDLGMYRRQGPPYET